MFVTGCALAGLGACSDTPANVAGTYAVTLTDGSDGCQVFEGQLPMAQSTITVAITQTGSQIQADVEGDGEPQLMALVGTHVFTGTVDGDTLQLAITGAFTRTIEGCNYKLDAVIAAAVDGARFSGSLSYRAVSEDPTCMQFNDAGSSVTGATACDSDQSMSGEKQ
jgi:hypothetical protein